MRKMNHMVLINSESSRVLLEFNKLAVSFLEQGKCKEAFQQFSMGLKKAHSKGEVACSSDRLQSSHGENNSETETLLRITTLPPMEGDDDSSNFFILFDHALSYDDSLLLSTTEQSVDLSLVTSVYLFNIGLTFHRQGMAKGMSSLLAEALRFYNLAHESSRGQSICRDSYDYQLVMFAVYNNMGNIFARSFDRENASLCYRFIVDLAPSESRALAENEAFIATLYNLISGQEMFQFAPAA